MTKEELKNVGELGTENGKNSGGSSGISSAEHSSGNSGGSSRRPVKSTGGKSGQVDGVSGKSNSGSSDNTSGSSGGSSGRSNRSNRGNSGNTSGSNRGSDGTVDAAGGSEAGNSSTNEKIVSSPSIDGLEPPKAVKPKRTSSKKVTVQAKKDGSITDPETLAVIIETGFGMLAGVTRRKHWEIASEEALTIAKPASTMIAKLTVKQRNKINQLAAPVMLATAIISVCMPRVMIDLAQAKGGVKVERTVKPSLSGTIEKTDTVNRPEPVPVDNQTVNNSLDPEVARIFNGMVE